MAKVSELIFSGDSVIIPMADVQHIERHWFASDKATKDNYRGIKVITKYTRWDMQAGLWANNIYLDRKEADKFIQAWCYYRHELEGDTIVDPPKSEILEKQPCGENNKQSESLLCPECDGCFLIVSVRNVKWRKCFRCHHEWQV